MNDYVYNVPYTQNGQTLYYSGPKSGMPSNASGSGTQPTQNTQGGSGYGQATQGAPNPLPGQTQAGYTTPSSYNLQDGATNAPSDYGGVSTSKGIPWMDSAGGTIQYYTGDPNPNAGPAPWQRALGAQALAAQQQAASQVYESQSNVQNGSNQQVYYTNFFNLNGKQYNVGSFSSQSAADAALKTIQAQNPGITGATPMNTTDPSNITNGQYGTPYSGSNSTSTNTNTNTTTTDTSGNSTGAIAYNAGYGISQSTWNQMNATQQAVVASVYDSSKTAYQTTGQQITFADALKNAATDPAITTKYADQLNLDKASLQSSIQELAQTAAATASTEGIQFQQDRLALAQQYANNGEAYSGFRGLAQKQLGGQESAVIQSTNAKNQAALDQMTQQYEAKYGSAATNPATLSTTNPLTDVPTSISGQAQTGQNNMTNLTGNRAGNVVGTDTAPSTTLPYGGMNYQGDIFNKATQLYNTGNYAPTLPGSSTPYTPTGS